MPIGYELAGVVTAIGPDAEFGSGGGAVGDEVLAFRIRAGYSTLVTVAAKDVFAKPASLPLPEAPNLLLAGTTAADMLRLADVPAGSSILVHGGSGAVGVMLLQQAAMHGLTVIATASERNEDLIRRFGGVPTTYGPGLVDRVRALAPDGITAAFDTVGTDEAVDVSLELVPDRSKVVTIAASHRALAEGFLASGGSMPATAAYRDRVRAELIALAGAGRLVVPMGRTFPLGNAVDALELIKTGHPGGKLALIP